MWPFRLSREGSRPGRTEANRSPVVLLWPGVWEVQIVHAVRRYGLVRVCPASQDLGCRPTEPRRNNQTVV